MSLITENATTGASENLKSTDGKLQVQAYQGDKPVYQSDVYGVAKISDVATHYRATGTGTVFTGACLVNSITIVPTTASVTAGTLTIYDNTDASSTVISTIYLPATMGPITLAGFTATVGVHVVFATLANVEVRFNINASQ